MNAPRILLLLAALTTASLAPLASANPEDRGYACVFGYNPSAQLNACDDVSPALIPSATLGQATVNTPCVVGNFPCSTVPSVTAPWVYVTGLPTGSCISRIDIGDATVLTSHVCIPYTGVYVCDQLVDVVGLVPRCEA
jgi:hypothetical protein